MATKGQIEKQKEKEIREALKARRREYGYKNFSVYLYQRFDELFVDVLYSIYTQKDGLYVKSYYHIKPYVYDDIFWKFMDMEANANARESLRVDGAFTCWPFGFFEDVAKLEDAESACEHIIGLFYDKSKEFMDSIGNSAAGFGEFILDYQGGQICTELMKALALINKGDMEGAVRYVSTELENHSNGGFWNEGRSIFQRILDAYR